MSRPEGSAVSSGPERGHTDVRARAGRILGITPFERPDPGLVGALARAGALGVLDLGRDPTVAREALAQAARRAPGGFGVRVPEGVLADPYGFPPEVSAVVLSSPEALASWAPGGWLREHPACLALVQVVSLDEARRAAELGADGLLVKGAESGGRSGEETAFVLLQAVAAAIDLPLWVHGGVGLHTAAACLAGGAHGVVLDAQLALLRESQLPEAVRAAVASMDGSETAIVGGQRIYVRPDLPGARMHDALPGAVLPLLGAGDLATDLVPAGQDAAFARPLADRFRSAGGLVHGLTAAMAEHLAAARAARPLAPDSPLARDHGVRYPIVQGPMTRVSDRAAFADAVARAGALPFLALSLMRGPEVRALLDETRALLGDRPWGVGILGFVPEDLRDEQLAVVRDARPPVAIIAGGRPSQARPLEEHGTATYLHVPSPGLLDLFLAEGARRFVFEGRECGGHVGPRTSLVLWELSIERLLAFLDAPWRGRPPRGDELSVLFAGGVHDARSAAMVAAMSAPLAERGVRVGVLMGTAYLFTNEAVTTGAIQPGFQEAAIACEKTALLETAPGHSTRCVETEYVRAFEDEKRRRKREGATSEETWAALEQMNLGRLRIAAKGVARHGGALEAVDEATQRREGMFMVGQVAALRSARLSMAELHSDVSEGGTARVAGLEAEARAMAPKRERPTSPPADVAIVGIGCIFPGAPDLEAFWSKIVLGASAITEVSKERWDPAIYFDPTSTNGNKTPSKWGGFISPVPFDPLAYGIPPKSLSAIEPVQLLSLEVAARALDDAGYRERPFDRERTSVIFGAEGGTDLSSAYGFRALYPQIAGELPKALDEHLPALTEDSFPGVLANVIAGRIANRLDLGGVNYTVDAACASSLAALDLAVKELSTGGSDMVLCGGADLHNGIHDYLMFSSVHALSPTGLCRTFDAAADGIVLGEGVACVVLKRLADAERDGDRVYAVIKAVAGGSDGRSLGLTAPRKEGQVRALDRAYARARLSPTDVGLVEAHGTGTVVGDRTELATLTEVFGAAGAPPGSCALGSVKSQIGHTKCAAGLAGIIKAALAIHHRVLPPTLHVTKPNPFYDAATSPFALSGVARPWPAERRVAAVSAFGFGGTNFHAVLEGSDDGAEAGFAVWPVELFLLRGASREGAVRVAGRLLALLERGEPFRLRDLAWTACSGHGRVHAAFVATDLGDLGRKLAAARASLEGGEKSAEGVAIAAADEARPGRVALLFPGQGSQRPHMLRELFVAFPELGRLLRLGRRWAGAMFPPAALTADDRAAQTAALTDTRTAQPALGMAGLAIAELLASVGVRGDMLAGHSYGELVALRVAGAFSEADLLSLSAARAACILEAAGADPGAMAAVSAGADEVARAIAHVPGVVIANANAPDQTVIAGQTIAIERAVADLERRGISARRIQVACAFHSPVVAGARETFAARLAGAEVGPLRTPVWSNATAALYPHDPGGIRALLAEQIARPVRFADQIERMYEAGARVFVEAGPGRVLTGLVGRILGARPHRAIACDQSTGSGLGHFLRATGELAAAGVPVDLRPLFSRRGAQRIDLDRPARVGPSPSAWLVDGQTSRPLGGEVPPGGLRPFTGPVLAPQTARVEGGAEEPVVLEYLRGMREIARAQRDVMLRFLGEAGSKDAPAPSSDEVVETRPAERKPAVTAEIVRLPVEVAPVESAADMLLGIVSDRTGYPIEMLDLDLNLEAELSIDSIKRIEILGVFSSRLGLASDLEGSRRGVVEELARVKTLRGILDWIDANGQRPASIEPPRITVLSDRPTLPSPSEAGDALEPPLVVHVGPVPALAGRADVAEPLAPQRITRRVARLAHAPAPVREAQLAGRKFAITDDGEGIAQDVAAWLATHGATSRILAGGEPLGDAWGVVDLAGLGRAGDAAGWPSADAVGRTALAAFDVLKEVAAGSVSTFVAASWIAPSPAPDGLGGLFRSAAKELPALRARAVGLDRTSSRADLVAQIGAEVATIEGAPMVSYEGGSRQVVTFRDVELARESRSGRLDLGPESVLLVTGGARGITAKVAVALALRFRCRLEIVGRSALPSPREAPDLANAGDARAIRRVLLARGELQKPAAIEAACARVLSDREIRTTLSAIERAGASLAYHATDVRDAAAFGAVIDGIYERHGRIDGVLHGAGVIEDRLIAQKTRESFARVFDTKVAAALTIAAKVRPDARFVVFFASVSGALGNAGQVDYAAANDALDTIARRLRASMSGRVVSIDWGPWAGAGMVAPELEREYARRGVGLIDPDEGVTALLDELSFGADDDVQVMLVKGDPDLAGELSQAPSEPRVEGASAPNGVEHPMAG